MKKVAIVVGALFLVLGALSVGRLLLQQILDTGVADWPAPPVTTSVADAQGSLYGRVTLTTGRTLEGRLRWGGDQEAFWGDYFNGSKLTNPWADFVPPDRLKESRPVSVFGFELAQRQHEINLDRPFMARFGDIARIEVERDLRVILKSGAAFDLDRMGADDIADGVRVWDAASGVVDLAEGPIRTVELLPGPDLGAASERLHGTVHTKQGDFTGFVQWNRQECLGTDRLDGRTPEGDLSLPFDTIRAIARQSADSSLVTLEDGSEILLSGTRETGDGHLGIYVDDHRYGRVLVRWSVFERIDFSSGGSGPAYGDFPLGGPITGSVTDRQGRRFVGRLVYDLDESEITETLDAPREGVNYTVPFGLIAAVVPGSEERRQEGTAGRVAVMLHSGEELRLERSGDLGADNAGLLIFLDGRESPQYVAWRDVDRIDIDPPADFYPPSSPSTD